MPTHRSNDYKLTAVQYYLVEDKRQEEVFAHFSQLYLPILVI